SIVGVCLCSEEYRREYRRGILRDCENDYYSLSHEVVVVGYGTDEKTKQDYWLVKNSMGTTYGENGYIR
ncbi:hypothetical protein L9F63_009166, partial [Diploptera punctata]